jgi:hypothetical protein
MKMGYMGTLILTRASGNGKIGNISWRAYRYKLQMPIHEIYKSTTLSRQEGVGLRGCGLY